VPLDNEERMRLVPVAILLAMLLSLAGASAAQVSPGSSAQGGTVLVITVNREGEMSAAGALPAGLPLRALRKRFPGIKLQEGMMAGRDAGDEGRWERLFDALDIALPRLRAGAAKVGEGQLGISGTLRSGFSAEATRGAVRLALGEAWEAEIQLAEAPPPAEITLTKTASGTEIRGILPAGIEPAEAQALVGGTTEAAMSSGGDGEASVWRQALAGLGVVVAVYAEAELTIAEGSIGISGALLPGYEAGQLGQWLRTQLGKDWTLRLEGKEQPAAEGATRLDVSTGWTERLKEGSWVPEFNFAPAPESCTEATARLLASGGITFVRGESRLTRSAVRLLDQLAALALHCIDEGGLQLEIGGHTDDVGNDADNLALSEERAAAVLSALARRGVEPDAMTTVGHGETRPIADNATEEGRAKNRRITFDWSR
jgi:OOP family OmpA-OmpF porin